VFLVGFTTEINSYLLCFEQTERVANIGRVSRQLCTTFINYLDNLQRKQMNKILGTNHERVHWPFLISSKLVTPTCEF